MKMTTCWCIVRKSGGGTRPPRVCRFFLIDAVALGVDFGFYRNRSLGEVILMGCKKPKGGKK